MCDTSMINTKGRITIMLGKHQLHTGQRLSPRRLAEIADVPKDLIYRLDAGTARFVDLQALARICQTLDCEVQDILIREDNGRDRLEHAYESL
jgi:DNA-binding Xre family transcriptional regulator